MTDLISSNLSNLNNSSKVSKSSIEVKSSKFFLEIAKKLQEYEYLSEITLIEDNKQGKVKIMLAGTINKCGSIKPRFPIKVNEIEVYEKKHLPAKDFGILLISTNEGLLTQYEAKEKSVGGTLVGYCY